MAQLTCYGRVLMIVILTFLLHMLFLCNDLPVVVGFELRNTAFVGSHLPTSHNNICTNSCLHHGRDTFSTKHTSIHRLKINSLTALHYNWKNSNNNNNNNNNNKNNHRERNNDIPEDSTTTSTTKIGATQNSATLDMFEALAVPVQGALDNITEGWALSYADLSPDDTQTVPGQIFLVSNTAYLIAGAYLAASGDVWLGMCTEIVAVASFNYHYQQLMNTGSTNAAAVRDALLIDYCFAFVSIGTANIYLLSFLPSIPVAGVAVGIAAFICLGLSWIWEYGKPYMIWHSLWHILSALSGYLIGSEHYMRTLP